MQKVARKVILFSISVSIFVALINIAGLYIVWRLMDQTRDKVFSYHQSFKRMVSLMNLGKDIIGSWNQRFCNLETEIRLQKNDSSRLIEWLAKERELRALERAEFLKALNITERESRIIEVSERLKVISSHRH